MERRNPLQGEAGGRSLGRGEVSAAEDAEGGKEKGGGRNQIQLEGTREVEEGKGEEEEEEGEKGEWEAGEEGCSPSPGELEGGQPEDRLRGGYKRQDRDAEGPAASAQPCGTRQAPSLEAQRILSPTAGAARLERGRCQPCPGELGAGAAEDGAQPTSCPPPPPPAGKML